MDSITSSIYKQYEDTFQLRTMEDGGSLSLLDTPYYFKFITISPVRYCLANVNVDNFSISVRSAKQMIKLIRLLGAPK